MLRAFHALTRAARVALSISILVSAVASAGLLAGCSDQSEQEGSPQGPPERVLRDADENTWAQAVRAGTLGAFTDYLQNFPNGKHVAEVRERIAALEAQARRDADERAWGVARQANTAAAYADYLRDFPDGAHAAEARERQAALDQEGRRQADEKADEKAWEEALRLGTQASLGDYLRQFPNGAHAAEARQRIAALTGTKTGPPAVEAKAGTSSGKKTAASKAKPKRTPGLTRTSVTGNHPVYKAKPSNPWFRWLWQ